VLETAASMKISMRISAGRPSSVVLGHCVDVIAIAGSCSSFVSGAELSCRTKSKVD
jgi:hypothetical protein